MQGALERAFTPRAVAVIKAQARAAAAAYVSSNGSMKAVNAAVKALNGRWVKILIPHWKRCAITFGKEVSTAAKKIGTKSEDAAPRFTRVAADMESAFAEALADWASNDAAQDVTGEISAFTMEQIGTAVNFGVEIGDSIPQIAKRILATQIGEGGDMTAKIRAFRIARTETHNASMFGMDAMAGASGLDLEKDWLANLDGRERPDHAAADGPRVPMNGKFKVGGVPMAYPGDRGAPAKQVVNCRCSMTFIVV
jgi:uncharacterized protein with gpF-like domain